jgi:hypothetical protein
MKQFKIFINVLTFISYPQRWVGQRSEIVMENKYLKGKFWKRYLFFHIHEGRSDIFNANTNNSKI